MMFKDRLYARYFAVAAFCICLFAVIGLASTVLLFRALMPSTVPYIGVAKLIDQIRATTKQEAVQKFLETRMGSFEQKILLIDENGQVLFPEKTLASFPKALLDSLKKPYDFREVSVADPPLARGWMGPPPSSAVIRLDNEPPLFVSIDSPRPPPSPVPYWILGLVPPLFLFGSLFVGVGITIYLVFRSLRKYTKKADEVISALQHGNLKARFKIERNDEIGQAMLRFNKMADEIEILVEHLRGVESARTKLLQELTHDLRTPIASLRGLLETVQGRGQDIGPSLKDEFLGLALKETDYFARLIDDLLFLARVSQPMYQFQIEAVDLQSILSEEFYDCDIKLEQTQPRKQLERNETQGPIWIEGDRYLLRRLFRNAFENATSFAKQEIRLTTEQQDGWVTVTIEDDGPGFSEEALKSFGERRMTRQLDLETNARVSLGLGSVVMKAICTAHRSLLEASNQTDSRGHVLGGKVRIKFQTSKPSLSLGSANME